MLAHIIRADQPFDGLTGYHSHALDFQMVYLFSGWARLYFEDIGEIRMEAGDAWYQPPGIRHEVLEYSDDWQVLEITLPADFEIRDEVRLDDKPGASAQGSRRCGPSERTSARST